MYVLFLVLWIIFNANFTWEIFFIGAILSAALYWFVCKFMDYSPKKDLQGLKKLGKVFQYIIILVVEIIKANGQVIHFILTSKYEVEPKLVKFRTDLKKDSSRAVLANSITLTGNEYVVHCLDKDLAEGMDDSIFVKQLRAMEQIKR